MPADVTKASKFLFTSDFPVDKLVILDKTDFVVPAMSNITIPVPHKLTFTPLMWGSWAMDANYTTIYGLNSGPISSTFINGPFDIILLMRANATNIMFEATNATNAPVHFYVRYFGFTPTTVDPDTQGTTPTGDLLQFNTDYNYTKLFLADYIDHPAGAGSPTMRTILHGLGKDTQLLAWKEDSGVIEPLTYHDAGDFQISDVVASIDPAQITFQFSGYQPALRIHYRMYIDE